MQNRTDNAERGRRVRLILLLWSVSLLALGACGSDTQEPAKAQNTPGQDMADLAGAGADMTRADDMAVADMTGADMAGAEDASADAEPEMGPTVIPDGLYPESEPLTGVEVEIDGDRARITFDPVLGARDYRVYPLPAADDLRFEGARAIVEGGVYRCAGDRMAPRVDGDDWVKALLEGNFDGFERSRDSAQLGWVSASPAEGLLPVYALGDPSASADNDCFGTRFLITRNKRYVTDTTLRDRLLSLGWRDEGVVFYAPAEGGDGRLQLFRARGWSDAQNFRVVEGSQELEERSDPERELWVFAEDGPDCLPLYRLRYEKCGAHNDMLVAGEARFERARVQGNLPQLELQWSPLPEQTVLVIEALDEGCPHQGHLSADDRPGVGNALDFITMESVASRSADGEVYLNGQHDPGNQPGVLRRSFVTASPGASPQLDFWDDFSSFDAPTEIDRETFGGWNLFMENARYHVSFYNIEPTMFSLGSVMGELRASYADWASDTNGKFRLTPRQKAQLAADRFLHVRASIELWSTGRRYPQIWISDQDVPVQDNMTEGTTLNVQTFGGWATDLEVQLCDRQFWDVNAQCPKFPVKRESFSDEPWAPRPVVGELSGVMRLVRVDVYASTSRAYVYLDEQPYACVDLPDGAFDAGPVTVTYGDTLYHSGVDEGVVGDAPARFLREHMLTVNRRAVDQFGYQNGVAAPSWDEELIPCEQNPE